MDTSPYIGVIMRHTWKCINDQVEKEISMNNIRLMAIDLAKNIFQVCALDKNDKVLFNKRLTRSKLIEFMSQQKPSSVYMEACYSSHYWARWLNQIGHNAFLIPAQHVLPLSEVIKTIAMMRLPLQNVPDPQITFCSC